ncbi:hypothetical protein IXO1088_008640 [Xanthomonas oryzae pv. oryzae]|nr:hypothetical protein IXO1088_008640 [Xanthomonas oryzae pv. oryzae]QIE19351.1 hypothetical protein IXO704_008585 [Xanthomonas oryzae pv. oryzae]
MLDRLHAAPTHPLMLRGSHSPAPPISPASSTALWPRAMPPPHQETSQFATGVTHLPCATLRMHWFAMTLSAAQIGQAMPFPEGRSLRINNTATR